MSAHQAALTLAHQGGWDELALVAAPLSLFAALLYLANRRANRLVAHGRGPADDQRARDDLPDDGGNA